MEPKELFQVLAGGFSIAGVITLNISCFTMKRAGLWLSQKAFGIETNWGLNKSISDFWRTREFVDLKVKHRLYFQWSLATLFFALALISLLLIVFLP
ncbi:MAG: hypothetical protein P1V19_21980 [Gimesia sp.]|nr:hypothetical protein [Gimesia sp.]